MTVRDFYNHVKDLDPESPEWDNELVVELDYPSLGKATIEPVTGVFRGFDWDSGRTFLLTAHKLVRSFKTRDIEQLPLEAIELKNLSNLRNPEK